LAILVLGKLSSYAKRDMVSPDYFLSVFPVQVPLPPIVTFFGLVMFFGLVAYLIVRWLLRRRAASSRTGLQTDTSESSQPSSKTPQDILEWIDREQRSAEALIGQGELLKASQKFSKILEHLYSQMASLAVLGPKNCAELKDKLEYKLDETTAKILLKDLQVACEQIDCIPQAGVNIFDQADEETLLLDLAQKGELLADQAIGIAEKRSIDTIADEAKELKVGLLKRVEDARSRLEVKE
jgi:hypothetical protein